MKKKIILMASLMCLICSPAFGQVLKIATLSPEGSEWMQKMRAGAKKIALKTDNRVKFKFYPGGIMGNDKAVLRKIRIGQLHGGAVTAGIGGLRLDSCVAIRFKMLTYCVYVYPPLVGSAFKPNRRLLNTLNYKIKT